MPPRIPALRTTRIFCRYNSSSSSNPNGAPPSGFPSLRGPNSRPAQGPADRQRILENLSDTLNRLAPQRPAPGAEGPGGQQPQFAIRRPQGAPAGDAFGRTPAAPAAAPEGAAAYEITPEDLKAYEMKFGQGTVYAPNDLSIEAWTQSRVQKMKGGQRDPFKLLGIDPRMEYKNYNLLAEYTTSMGRIKHRKETGLGGVSQRRIAKAIRRAVGLGLLPSTHYHPEILKARQLVELQKGRFR